MSFAAASAQRLDFEQIRDILPQRYPMIMLDRVLSLEPGSRIVAIKNVTGNEAYFPGHFPGLAVMPGVLIIEAAAQAAGILWGHDDSESSRPSSFRYHLASVNVSFHAPVTPGDQVTIDAQCLRQIGAFFIASVKATVEDTVVFRGELTLARTSV